METLEGKWSGHKKYSVAYDSLRDALNILTEEYSQYGKKNEIILPLQISKRKIYKRWQNERGWKVTRRWTKTDVMDIGENWGSLSWLL